MTVSMWLKRRLGPSALLVVLLMALTTFVTFGAVFDAVQSQLHIGVSGATQSQVAVGVSGATQSWLTIGRTATPTLSESMGINIVVAFAVTGIIIMLLSLTGSLTIATAALALVGGVITMLGATFIAAVLRGF